MGALDIVKRRINDGPDGRSRPVHDGRDNLRRAPVDVLITDVGLPGMNGRQFAGMDMVTKPFAIDAFALKIRQMMAQRAGA